MRHVEKELERIRNRLDGPLPLEHAALYSAQQALVWAMNPDQFASPVAWITGTQEERRDYCPTSRPELSERVVGPPASA
jgi:hypothetical protein